MPNYSFLKTDLINTAENDSTEYENQISKFVEKEKEAICIGIDEFKPHSPYRGR